MESHFPSSSPAWSSMPQTCAFPWGCRHLFPLEFCATPGAAGPSVQGVTRRPPVLGAVRVPGGFTVLFLPPNSSGLLDGSQGAKQSAVSAESSQVA